MKKLMAALLTLCLVASLAGCTEAPATPPASIESPSQVAEQTESPEMSATPSQAPLTMSEAPEVKPTILQLGENILTEISVNGLVERYGPYAKVETAFYEGNGSSYVMITYDKMVVELINNGQPLSFTPEDGAGFDFGEKQNELTDSDKAMDLTVQTVLWTDPQILGPRRTKVGDTTDSVMEKFLDKSDQFTDGTVYKLTDELEGYPEGEPQNDGAAITPWLGQMAIDMTANEALSYYIYEEDWYTCQYTKYYLNDGVVAGIEQGINGNEP